MPGFFCLWIPQFAAWTLSQSEPALQNRAFAVCERGVVVAASPLALEAGVQAGQTSGRAQGRLASLLIVARDPHRETLAWDEVQRAFYGLTPQVEAAAPGLLFAAVEPKKTMPLLRAWHGHGGGGADRATAHLAALSAEMGTVRVVRLGREAPFGDGMRLALLENAGVSAASLKRLEWFGWIYVGALRVLTRRQLEEQVGKDGAALFRFAQGPRCQGNLRAVSTYAPPEEVGAGLSLEFPAREPCEWEGALDRLLKHVCAGLGTRSARTLEVRVETPIVPLCARRVLKEPLNEAKALRAPMLAALGEALEMLAPLPPVITKLEVRLGALVCAPTQDSLFAGDKTEKVEKPKRLRAALESMEARFAGKSGHYVPAEADSPFPEEQWRLDPASGWLPALESLQKRRRRVKAK
ncbi:MAG TPA: hypothetical protein VF627_11100 [Abditibacterium sp.]|jgi:hypothetical protein